MNHIVHLIFWIISFQWRVIFHSERVERHVAAGTFFFYSMLTLALIVVSLTDSPCFHSTNKILPPLFPANFLCRKQYICSAPMTWCWHGKLQVHLLYTTGLLVCVACEDTVPFLVSLWNGESFLDGCKCSYFIISLFQSPSIPFLLSLYSLSSWKVCTVLNNKQKGKVWCYHPTQT